ncbi:MAG: hypothetical protein IPQ08_01430 [Chitinophagaceae bacterium]|nr:hypothetical protein [Chitinophagaceae bacterium]
MKYFLVLVAGVLLTATACNKDKFKTEPQVEVKSISPGTVVNGNIISLKGNYTDDEGDLDSVLLVYKWYNNAAIVRNDTFRFNFANLGLPDKVREADIQVLLEYNTQNQANMVSIAGVSLRDTTASFGLLLIDKAGHRSNYAEAGKIRLKKP